MFLVNIRSFSCFYSFFSFFFWFVWGRLRAQVVRVVRKPGVKEVLEALGSFILADPALLAAVTGTLPDVISLALPPRHCCAPVRSRTPRAATWRESTFVVDSPFDLITYQQRLSAGF
jgi:hypothetical protein